MRSPPWQVFGVGLWYPGAGFLILGERHGVLTIVTLVVFGFSLVGWVAAGACTFPPLVWFASAAIASMMTGSHISQYGVAVAIALALAAIAIYLVRETITQAWAARTRAERIAYLPTKQIAGYGNSAQSPPHRSARSEHSARSPRGVRGSPGPASARGEARNPGTANPRRWPPADVMPRQGSKLPWKVLMHYEKDFKMLLDDPVNDGLLRFAATRIELAA